MFNKKKFSKIVLALFVVASFTGCCLSVATMFGMGIMNMVDQYKEGIYVADFTTQLGKNISDVFKIEFDDKTPENLGMKAKLKEKLKTQIDKYLLAVDDLIESMKSNDEGRVPTDSALRVMLKNTPKVKVANFFKQTDVENAIATSLPTIQVFNGKDKDGNDIEQFDGKFADYSNKGVQNPLTIATHIVVEKIASENWATKVNDMFYLDYKPNAKENTYTTEVKIISSKLPQVEKINLTFNGNVGITNHSETVASICGTPEVINYDSLKLTFGIRSFGIELESLKSLTCGKFEKTQKDIDSIKGLFGTFKTEVTDNRIEEATDKPTKK